MIEYKAYHKAGGRKRGRDGRAVRKREKGKPGGTGRMSPQVRLRLAGWIAGVLLSVALAGVAAASAYAKLTRSPLFSVRSVDINPGTRVTQEEVWAIVRSAGRGNIWDIPAREVARRLSDHPWVRAVSVRKVLPDRFVVRIDERRPVAMVNLDALYYVDAEGSPFKRLTAYDPKDYPILTGFSRGDLLARDAVTLRNFRKTLDLVRLAGESAALRQNLSEVHFDAQDGYTLVIRDSGLQLKVGLTDFPEAMRRIEEALPRLSGLGASAGIVNLKTRDRIFVR
jgi:cell division protein FtsQ